MSLRSGIERNRVVIACLVWILGISTLFAVAPVPVEQKWVVDGVDRIGLVYTPSSAEASPTPVVFAFHGHGGTMQNAARLFAYQGNPTALPEISHMAISTAAFVNGFSLIMKSIARRIEDMSRGSFPIMAGAM